MQCPSGACADPAARAGGRADAAGGQVDTLVKMALASRSCKVSSGSRAEPSRRTPLLQRGPGVPGGQFWGIAAIRPKIGPVRPLYGQPPRSTKQNSGGKNSDKVWSGAGRRARTWM